MKNSALSGRAGRYAYGMNGGMSTHMKKALWGFGGLLLLCAALAALSVRSASRLTVTVSALVQSADGRQENRISANEQAQISSGAHGAAYRGAAMRGGTLTADCGYGPVSVKGSVSAGQLLAACPELSLTKDWDFTLAMFNTSEGRTAAVSLNLIISAETMTARAVLRVDCDGYARPFTDEKAVAIGEDFGFRFDY